MCRNVWFGSRVDAESFVNFLLKKQIYEEHGTDPKAKSSTLFEICYLSIEDYFIHFIQIYPSLPRLMLAIVHVL